MGEYTLDREGETLLVRATRVLLSTLVASRLRERWSGEANVPETGGAVVAYNHISVSDPFVAARFVYAGAGRFPHFLGKAEVFAVPVIGRLLLAVGQIPVHRGTARARDSYDSAVAAVRGGQVVVMLPEGTITKDPQLWPMKGKTGAARIALETGRPLVPVAVWGPQRIVPADGLPLWKVAWQLHHRHEVTVAAGEPVDLSDFQARPVDAQTLGEATERLMDAITMLLEEIRHDTAPATRMDNPRIVSRLVRTPEKTSGDAR